MQRRGGGAGRFFGEGFVYVMKTSKRYKIGCSKSPEKRRKQIAKTHSDVKLIRKVKATEMNGAETAAQKKVQKKLKMKKVVQNATDWFKAPAKNKKKKEDQIKDAVRTAVYAHNRKQKK